MPRPTTLGAIVATPGFLAKVDDISMRNALKRYTRGDWGDVCYEDKQANETALKQGSRVLAAYTSAAGVAFWIITEGDRSVTTFLLPEEY